MPTTIVYTPGEELANALTHALGALLSVAALVLLITIPALRGDGRGVVCGMIFGAALVTLYTSSTVYHSVRAEGTKRFFRKLDHASIFLLIAGTYTPYLLVSLRGPWGWSLFGVIWGLCMTGIIFKFFLAGRFRVLSTGIYILTGWLIVIAIKPLSAALPMGGVWLLGAGGLCYTGGTVFYLWKSLRYHHAIWHLFVLGGSTCHFLSVFWYVLPMSAV